jgi:cyclohexyl-isocyanide hydratase
MKIAYIIFNGINWLDLAGVYEPISILRSAGYRPDLQWDICSWTPEAADEGGLRVLPTLVGSDLGGYDAIIVPGGKGTRTFQHNEGFLQWLRTAGPVPLKISVCTGSLLLGAAGFLQDKTATTHFKSYEALAPYCRSVSHERITEDGDCITAGAVTASIDLGLYLCRKWAGDEADVYIRHIMDYRG